MAVPSVSHRNWWLTKANAQIAMGSKEIDARNLSFEDCISLIAMDEPYREMAKEEGYDYYHPEWDSVEIVWAAGDRERPHRPSLPSEEMDEWVEMVQNEWPGVPVESVSFDRQLALFLKRRHEWYMRLNTGFKIENTDTGEVFHSRKVGSNPKRVLD